MEDHQDLIRKASVLIEALPYMQRFRDATVVVKFGGSAMEDEAITRSTLRDIVFMECVGMRPVLVHGGGKAISARLKELGIQTRFINGLRYTCAETIGVVDDVLHNIVNAELVDGVKESGGRAVPLSGKSILGADKMMSQDQETGEPIDLGFVGEAARIDPEPIRAIIELNQVPVITPLGVGEDGQTYNINADIAACRIAEALKARKLVFLSDVPGLLRDPNDESTLISTVRRTEVPALIEQGIIAGGMAPKIASAVKALESGTNKVHLIDARLQHSLLLEMFTDRGVGTQIIRD